MKLLAVNEISVEETLPESETKVKITHYYDNNHDAWRPATIPAEHYFKLISLGVVAGEYIYAAYYLETSQTATILRGYSQP